MDDHIHGSQQNTHYPKEKFPKIITHKWKFGNLLEAPNTLPMEGLFVTNFESNEGKRASVQLQVNFQLQNKKKSPQFWWLFSLWCFT